MLCHETNFVLTYQMHINPRSSNNILLLYNLFLSRVCHFRNAHFSVKMNHTSRGFFGDYFLFFILVFVALGVSATRSATSFGVKNIKCFCTAKINWSHHANNCCRLSTSWHSQSLSLKILEVTTVIVSLLYYYNTWGRFKYRIFGICRVRQKTEKSGPK